MPDIVITPNRGTSSNPKIDFTGTSAGTIKLEVLADGTIAWNGANGSLFSIADSLSGSLMSVNDISGLPAFEVFSDNRVIVGQFGANLLLGTTTNSSNGRLQLATHTAVTGGIGFGTDIGLYRIAANKLAFRGAADAEMSLRFNRAGGSYTTTWENYIPAASTDLRWYNGADRFTLTASGNATFSGTATASQLISNASQGTAPLVVTSSTQVSNLNAQYLNGYSSDTANTANAIVRRDGSGNFSAGTITATLAGLATSETLSTVTGRGATTASQISVNSSAGGSMLTGTKAGGTYGDGVSGATFKSILDNANGGAAFAFSSYYGGSGGTLGASIRADGYAYFKEDVGIGTNSPSGKLDVRVAGTGTWDRFIVTTTTSWGDGSTQYVTIGAGGASGIMLSNPHVVWNSGNSAAGIRMGRSGGVSSGAWYEVGTGTSDSFHIKKESTTRLHIDTNGNVGIGTTSPGYKLDVNGSFNATSFYHSGTAGHITKEYTFNLSAQSNTQFFPIRLTGTPIGAGGIHTVEVVMDSFGGADPYNHHSVVGKVRGSGWTDLPAFYDVFHNCYQDSERSYLGFYRGTQNCTDVVLYVRGGKTYYVKTPSTASVSTTALTVGDSVFAIKDSNAADVSGTSANISFMVNLITAAQGRLISHNFISGNNIGIGTTSPGYKLDVNGDGAFVSNGSARVLYLKQNANNTGNIIQFRNEGGGDIWELVGRNNQFYIYNTSLLQYSFYITPSTGNVGISTSSPAYKLDVSGTLRSTTDAYFATSSGSVGIGTTSPAYKLDVTGDTRISGNFLAHKVASYTTSYPGINSFGASAIDTTGITYYDTGKNLPNTLFRGVVWTGKHYIFTDYSNNRAYFYDNNFDSINNAYGVSYVSLPMPAGYSSPHGAAWDGRYLWIFVYNGTNGKIVGYDIDTAANATIIAESAALAVTNTYDVEYADGHLYLIKAGTLYIYKWNGSTIDQVATKASAAGTIDAQAITYDGSYLWCTSNGTSVYKLKLDGTQVSVISSGFPPDICGWAWNGSNIVTFDYDSLDIYIIYTSQYRIDTEKLTVMGGSVGINTTNPGARLEISDGSSYFRIAGNSAGDFQAPALAPHIATGDFTIYSGAIGSGTARVIVKNAGNVGIGLTSNIRGILHVNGSNYSESPTVNKLITVSDSANSDRYMILGYHSTPDCGVIQGLHQSTAWKPVSINPNGANVGIGTASPSYKLDVNGDVRVTGTLIVQDGVASTNVFGLTTLTKSLTVTTSWIDVGISGSDLTTGSYIIQVFVDNYNVSGGQYAEYYTGFMSWTSGATNSTDVDEIVLHKAGHAPNGNWINLRTVRQASSILKLQIIASGNTSGASNYVFKFRRMI